MKKYFLTVMFLSGTLVAQDKVVPWQTDVKTVRENALKEGKPCVIILHVNSGAL